MAQIKDIQWKYQNNSIIMPGYIKAELTQEDCLKAGNKFYVATIPEGFILQGIIAYTSCGLDDSVSITVDIGANDCLLCSGIIIPITNSAACVSDCECMLMPQDHIAVVTLDEDIPTGCVTLLFKVVNPNAVSGCAVDPIELEYETAIIEPCTTSGCPEKCPDMP